MAKMMNPAPRRRRCASCLAPFVATISASISTTCISSIARILYLQVDNVFGLFLLFPSIVAGTITLGLMTQITNVFGQYAARSSI